MKNYLRKLLRVIGELAAIGLAVILLQWLIDGIGFEVADPVLALVLVVLIHIIASARE